MAKLAKPAVEFEHPAKGPHHCAECRHFAPPDACRIVAGRVMPRDWCNHFESRAASRQEKRAIHTNAISRPTGGY